MYRGGCELTACKGIGDNGIVVEGGSGPGGDGWGQRRAVNKDYPKFTKRLVVSMAVNIRCYDFSFSTYDSFEPMPIYHVSRASYRKPTALTSLHLYPAPPHSTQL